MSSHGEHFLLVAQPPFPSSSSVADCWLYCSTRLISSLSLSLFGSSCFLWLLSVVDSLRDLFAFLFVVVSVAAVGSGVAGSSQYLSAFVPPPCYRCHIQFSVSLCAMGLAAWPFLFHFSLLRLWIPVLAVVLPAPCIPLSTCSLSASSWSIRSSISFSRVSGSCSSLFSSSSPSSSLCCCCGRLRGMCSL